LAVLFCYVFGVVLMMVSDCQKYYILKIKPGLISNGMFARVRNPNYLGEILLYLSFSMCVGNTIAYAIPLTVWITVFIPFMKTKDLSL
jgi:protein-S-isoprenylcysteine O-methyltransferase Ste14